MIIQRITLENFRQFRGQQEVDFAHGTKNVTVIFGENGRGKTGLFRALMFCLYGATSLEQDGSTDTNVLVNEPAIRESPGTPVEAKVKLDFEHEGVRYSLTRTHVGLLTARGEVSQEPGTQSLDLTDQDGRTTYVDRESIPRVIGKVLNEKIRDYFLFDGERIERLTRPGKTQVEDVRKGIRAILSLDDLDIALKGLEKLIKHLNSEVTKNTTGELQALEIQQLKLDEQLEDLGTKIETNKLEQVRLESELARFSDQLSKIEEVKKLEDERKERSIHLAQVKNNLIENLNKMKPLINFGGALVAGPQLGALSEYLKSKVNSGELPQKIKAEFVERLLDDQRCICGTTLTPNSEPEKELNRFRQRLPRADDAHLLELWNALTSLCERRSQQHGHVETSLRNYHHLEQDIRRVEAILEELSGQIKSQGGDNVVELEEARSGRLRTQLDLKAEEQNLQEELERLLQSKTRLTQEIATEATKSRQAIRIRKKRDLTSDAKTCLSDLKERFTSRVREELEKESTGFFQALADEGTRMSLDRVIINDDYSLGVGSKYGDEVLADISAGQRQIVSLSFISALIKVASGGGGV